MEDKLKFVQLSSSVNPSFWNKLTELKLNVDKLNETERHSWGYFSILRNNRVCTPLLEVDSTSFNENFNGQNMYVPFEGKIVNKNTIEQFKDCNKMDFINTEGISLYKNIVSGEALKRPSILNSFVVLSFADLKKYHYYYWFAFPVPYGLKVEIDNSKTICDEFKEEMVSRLYDNFRELPDIQKPYFIIEHKDNNLILHTLEDKLRCLDSVDNVYFAFFNNAISDNSVGSHLRNYVVLILHYCPLLEGKSLKFIALSCARNGSKINIDPSVVCTIKLPRYNENDYQTWVGWEPNEREKMGPRMANMKNTLDPKVLAENAIDLNLKLMKWRILPEIDLEKVKNTKCLLLGSGTLGCTVARSLLAWGVRNITFVDNATVSFSNPVRQNLFTYEDSVNMRPKSEAAADNLRKIFPGVSTQGIELTIPMPGHSVGETLLEQTIQSVDKLTELIKDNEIIFLLMDSRESRWLPTMLGSFYNKIVINAALGFDSYLIMRHGFNMQGVLDHCIVCDIKGYKVIEGHNLGCYFCNDVTAPGDSIKNRTLDQQCTVTRPGVSQIAGALAVELAVSVLQHKDGLNASAIYQTSTIAEDLDPEVENQCVLGLVPHSIRGFLSSFNQILPATLKYNQCVACSEAILNEYKNDGFNFLLKVFNSSKYLEDVTKLTEMFNDFNLEEVLEFTDEDFEEA